MTITPAAYIEHVAYFLDSRSVRPSCNTLTVSQCKFEVAEQETVAFKLGKSEGFRLKLLTFVQNRHQLQRLMIQHLNSGNTRDRVETVI